MPYQKLAEAVLAEWREIERQLDALGPDAAAYEGALAEANRLRDEYHRLIEDAIAHHRPVPPPFPDSETPRS